MDMISKLLKQAESQHARKHYGACLDTLARVRNIARQGTRQRDRLIATYATTAMQQLLPLVVEAYMVIPNTSFEQIVSDLNVLAGEFSK